MHHNLAVLIFFVIGVLRRSGQPGIKFIKLQSLRRNLFRHHSHLGKGQRFHLFFNLFYNGLSICLDAVDLAVKRHRFGFDFKGVTHRFNLVRRGNLIQLFQKQLILIMDHRFQLGAVQCMKEKGHGLADRIMIGAFLQGISHNLLV